MHELKTINEVCKMLNMTSRTIRYYEQCGLIKTIRESKTAPRKLDDKNIERLRKIRFLKKLRLTLDEIAVVIDNNAKAAEMIYSKTAELKAEIRVLTERIGLIEEVLAVAENGGNIYSVERKPGQPSDNIKKLQIATECTN
ncbi:MAG: MerR family transcriptional regulator, partial [Oscillospiraceae bacterium]|nr:MerR family transcriptional regulator [Oscillospiraceae bacterium]